MGYQISIDPLDHAGIHINNLKKVVNRRDMAEVDHEILEQSRWSQFTANSRFHSDKDNSTARSSRFGTIASVSRMAVIAI